VGLSMVLKNALKKQNRRIAPFSDLITSAQAEISPRFELKF
jgi:hypothetical protein